MKTIFTIVLLLLVFSACSRDKKNDVRNARWGMTKEQVKKAEDADLVKEGENILTYRIGGNTVPVKIKAGQSDLTSEDGEPITPPQVEGIGYEYDLLYIFGENGLGMVVIHLRESFDEPGQYMELFKARTDILTKKIGEPARGVASYSDNQVKADPYEDPAAICRGEHRLQHVWPTINKRTNVSLELDQKKFASEPDCNLSLFYESIDIRVDQELSDELHEVL